MPKAPKKQAWKPLGVYERDRDLIVRAANMKGMKIYALIRRWVVAGIQNDPELTELKPEVTAN